MTIPLLTYTPSSQNQRVEGFEVSRHGAAQVYTTYNSLDLSEMDMLIQAAYRQVFNEQQCITHHRQVVLESQLLTRQITVRNFIRGLVLSDSFRRLNYEVNNNYRFTEMVIQRVLGRSVYNIQETLAWSIILATKGLNGFIDALINSEEYLDQFGENTVPYQRRRILPQRSQGEVTFAHMARYGANYRDKLPKPNLTALRGTGFTGSPMSSTRWAWQNNPPKQLERIWIGLFFSGSFFIMLLFFATLLGL
jgi:phycobilisome rod-core linker protein